MSDAKELAIRAVQVQVSIYEYFLSHGSTCTIKQLAAHMKRSEAWVRKVLAENHGCPRGCVMSDGQVEKHSKSYPDQVVGYQKVDTYQPTMETMRQAILALRSDHAQR